MVRIRFGIAVVVVCILFLHASYIYADDDFGNGSDPEPTGPVMTISPDVSQTPQPTEIRNRAPIAEAGPSITVSTGALVVLNGADSRDPDGNIVSYAWKQLSGPPVELLSSRTSHPSFSSGNVDASYIFQLTVRDTRGATAIDVVTIVVKARPAIFALPTIPVVSVPTSTPLPPASKPFPVMSIAIIALVGIFLVLVSVFIKVISKGRAPSASGVVRNVLTRVPLEAVEVQFVDQGTNTIAGTYTSNDQGQFFAYVPAGVYIVSAKKQGHAPFSREGVVIPPGQDSTIYVGIDLMSLVP